jgi:hypothetical protein
VRNFLIRTTFLVAFFLVLAGGKKGHAQNLDEQKIVWMVPVPGTSQNHFRPITAPDSVANYLRWLDNYSARQALHLYQLALSVAKRSYTPFYIALVPGGNHAELGFTLLVNGKPESYPKTPYIKLDPDPYGFSSVLLHETGHMILMLLNQGRKLPVEEVAAIPHSTAALTDRTTAFDEGFAIHLETLAALYAPEPELRRRYQRTAFQYGRPGIGGEYYRQASDLFTYAQTRSRYHEVVENSFAFAPACQEADYLRVQLDKSRDFARLRTANQLLQSEGFYASFFIGSIARGAQLPDSAEISRRYLRLFQMLHTLFTTTTPTPHTPYLLDFVKTCLYENPAEGREMLALLMDVSHGVFVDREALDLWREQYEGALKMDMKLVKNQKIEQARTRWVDEVLQSPDLLYSLTGPVLRVEVPQVKISLVALESEAPLSFDLNTVEPGILKLVPGISQAEIDRILNEREQRPYQSWEDFMKRVALSRNVSGGLVFSK